MARDAGGDLWDPSVCGFICEGAVDHYVMYFAYLRVRTQRLGRAKRFLLGHSCRTFGCIAFCGDRSCSYAIVDRWNHKWILGTVPGDNPSFDHLYFPSGNVGTETDRKKSGRAADRFVDRDLCWDSFIWSVGNFERTAGICDHI